MTTILRNVRPYGEDAVDITWDDGVITGISAAGSAPESASDRAVVIEPTSQLLGYSHIEGISRERIS